MKVNLLLMQIIAVKTALSLIYLVCLLLLFFLIAMSHFKVGTLNVNGAREARKRFMIYEEMKVKRIDVFLIQETHSDSTNYADWRREWEGHVILSHSTTSSGGVGLLFSNCTFTPKAHKEENDPGSHSLCIGSQADKEGKEE